MPESQAIPSCRLCPSAAAAVAALVVAAYAVLLFEGPARNYRLWYYVPAAALAGALVAERLSNRSRPRWLVDSAVAVVCLARPLTGQPPVSGHALFAVFVLITARDPVTRVLALALAVLTIYAKIVLWHWDVTLWPGLAAGLVAGWVWRRCRA